MPIVPIVAAGAHDGWWIWTRGDRIARALGLKRFLRIDVFPLGLGLPFGVVIGPIFPFIPLPRKIILEILPPIRADNSAESVLAQQIESTMSITGHLPQSGIIHGVAVQATGSGWPKDPWVPEIT